MLWFVPLLISLALSVVSYLLAPKPKKAKAEAAQQLEAPTADAGKPVMVVFGTITVKELNILWYGQKSQSTYSVKV